MDSSSIISSIIKNFSNESLLYQSPTLSPKDVSLGLELEITGSLKYNFAIDNNFDKSNYDAIATTLSVNKFITTFEYSDEKNNLLNQSFTSNSSSYQFDNNNSINLNIRRNNDLSATEYYNLIYNYKNDCLTASVKFNKEFYQDSDLEPEKEIFYFKSTAIW